MLFVEMQALVLLFEQFTFAHVRKEQLFTQVGSRRVNYLHLLEQFGRLFVLTECCVDEDQVLDRVRVALILRLDLCEQVEAIRMLTQFHERIGLDRNEKRLLRIL